MNLSPLTIALLTGGATLMGLLAFRPRRTPRVPGGYPDTLAVFSLGDGADEQAFLHAVRAAATAFSDHGGTVMIATAGEGVIMLKVIKGEGEGKTLPADTIIPPASTR